MVLKKEVRSVAKRKSAPSKSLSKNEESDEEDAESEDFELEDDEECEARSATIHLRVRADNYDDLVVETTEEEPLETVLARFCTARKLDIAGAYLTVDGGRIKEGDTPAVHCLDDDDEVSVELEEAEISSPTAPTRSLPASLNDMGWPRGGRD